MVPPHSLQVPRVGCHYRRIYTGGIHAAWLVGFWGLFRWIYSDDRLYLLAFAAPGAVWTALIVHIARLSRRISAQGKPLLNELSSQTKTLTSDERALKAILSYKILDDSTQCAKILDGLDPSTLTDDRYASFVKGFNRARD